MDHLRLLALAACCVGLGACGESPAQTRGPSQDLDIGRYQLTFNETFAHLDVSAWGPGTRWIAHTPWHGDFGDAAFADPEPGFPFATASNMLRIEARKDANGHWRSGLIAAHDRQAPGGPGFAQAFGYFEIETKLPPGPGLWPAFWLSSADKTSGAEIDVLEYYGKFNDGYHTTVHVWGEGDARYGEGKIIPIPAGIGTDQFNRYGVLIEQDWVSFYFNRKQVWRTKTRPEFRVPMFPLANLALGSGWPIDKTPSPSFMYIKSIAAYEKKP